MGNKTCLVHSGTMLVIIPVLQGLKSASRLSVLIGRLLLLPSFLMMSSFLPSRTRNAGWILGLLGLDWWQHTVSMQILPLVQHVMPCVVIWNLYWRFSGIFMSFDTLISSCIHVTHKLITFTLPSLAFFSFSLVWFVQVYWQITIYKRVSVYFRKIVSAFVLRRRTVSTANVCVIWFLSFHLALVQNKPFSANGVKWGTVVLCGGCCAPTLKQDTFQIRCAGNVWLWCSTRCARMFPFSISNQCLSPI